ncbi:hypothetical protein Taro_040902 [Colocasia esculenta]|uniref:Uncharacterized protein n=1 Tax=Colocasia esculenta TaxID=4460 RepID=A0A843WUB7_COLES|nr:hypothetical protein [Colocasia esculenta]
MLQTQSKNMKNWSSSVDTRSRSVDTRDLPRTPSGLCWDSVLTLVQAVSTVVTFPELLLGCIGTNILADALASLASSLSFPLSRSAETITVQRLEAPSTQDPWFVNLRSSLVFKAERKEAKELLLVELGEMMVEERMWYHEIEQYCRDSTFPEEAEAEDRRAIRRAALKYTLVS